MANYRDAAAAEYLWRIDQDAVEEDVRRAELVAAAQRALIPLFTDHDGKRVLDPTSKTDAVHVDREARLVVLVTTDGSVVHFAVNTAPTARVWLTRLADGEWVRGPEVFDLDDVGRELATGQGW